MLRGRTKNIIYRERRYETHDWSQVIKKAQVCVLSNKIDSNIQVTAICGEFKPLTTKPYKEKRHPDLTYHLNNGLNRPPPVFSPYSTNLHDNNIKTESKKMHYVVPRRKPDHILLCTHIYQHLIFKVSLFAKCVHLCRLWYYHKKAHTLNKMLFDSHWCVTAQRMASAVQRGPKNFKHNLKKLTRTCKEK